MPWLRLFALMFAVVLAIPAAPAPAVEAASLKDQIADAKKRQAALTKDGVTKVGITVIQGPIGLLVVTLLAG